MEQGPGLFSQEELERLSHEFGLPESASSIQELMERLAELPPDPDDHSSPLLPYLTHDHFRSLLGRPPGGAGKR